MQWIWKLLNLLQAVGGLVVYWTALFLFGIKPAIGVTLVFVLGDGLRRWLAKGAFPPIWVLSGGAALLFGGIDLCARTPFMIRYEAAIINLAWAAGFAVGALGSEPLVLKFARRRSPDIEGRPEIIRFFRAFTFAWSLYFVLRAGAYLWIMDHFAFKQALVIRTIVGWASMGVMLVISIMGRQVFLVCQWFGLFRPKDPDLAS